MDSWVRFLSPTCIRAAYYDISGGYISGAALQYDGADLLRESNNNVVTVIIQYRLGLFGFLSGSRVKADGVLNAGLCTRLAADQT